MELNICHLYPDVLNLHGDGGNLLCLRRRLQWRDIDCTVTRVCLGAKADLSSFDLFFMGAGEEFQQQVILDDLMDSGKADEIVAAVEDEKVFLCVSGGMQLMGQYTINSRGEQVDYIGALDMHTQFSPQRMVGNYMLRRMDDFSGSIVVGFESHCGKTILGSGVKPLGQVISGFGNTGDGVFDGARYKNVYGTYCHGPILPKNPQFADSILLAALKRKYNDAVLSTLEDSFELAAHDYMKNRLGGE